MQPIQLCSSRRWGE